MASWLAAPCCEHGFQSISRSKQKVSGGRVERRLADRRHRCAVPYRQRQLSLATLLAWYSSNMFLDCTMAAAAAAGIPSCPSHSQFLSYRHEVGESPQLHRGTPRCAPRSRDSLQKHVMIARAHDCCRGGGVRWLARDAGGGATGTRIIGVKNRKACRHNGQLLAPAGALRRAPANRRGTGQYSWAHVPRSGSC
jgi:hypothetical protein